MYGLFFWEFERGRGKTTDLKLENSLCWFCCEWLLFQCFKHFYLSQFWVNDKSEEGIYKTKHLCLSDWTKYKESKIWKIIVVRIKNCFKFKLQLPTFFELTFGCTLKILKLYKLFLTVTNRLLYLHCLLCPFEAIYAVSESKNKGFKFKLQFSNPRA